MKAEQQKAQGDLESALSGSIPDTKAKPETALPWSTLRDGDSTFSVHSGDCMVAEFMYEKDAAYLIHACNAYPKLVAALKKLARPVEYADTPAGLGELIAGHELLHHLGEIE